ncbi:MAG: tetratricopeptide repeat protein, partial [Deltaproteobacteria bacterium]|nr:tetratricopeptide repeat protein [Deltaproteobacteria bacterium]
KAGVSEKDLDQGYTDLEFASKKEVLLKGKNDGKVQEKEVYEYIFRHADQFHDLVSGITGNTSLGLDDFDPKTNFDSNLRNRIQAVQEQIKILLKEQGLDEKSSDFKVKLAVALFHWAILPSDPKSIQKKSKEWKQATQELETIGLKTLQDEWIEKGGLGLSDIKGDIPDHISPLEALQKKRGGSVEKSRILFSIFQIAGLEADFKIARWKDVDSSLKEKGLRFFDGRISVLYRQEYHSFVQLNLDGKTRSFDPTFQLSENTNLNALSLSPFQMAVTEMCQSGFSHVLKGNIAGGILALMEVARLEPHYPLAHNNLGLLLFMKGDSAEGTRAFKKAASLDPQIPTAFLNLGNASLTKQDYKAAIEYYQKSIQNDALLSPAHYGLANAYFQSGQKEEAEKAMNQAVKLDPQNIVYQMDYSQMLMEMDKAEAALEVLKKASHSKSASEDPKVFYLIAKAHEKLGNEDERRTAMLKSNDLSETLEKKSKKKK